MADSLLTAELLRRLEQLQLLARRRSRSQNKGERRSRARGHSVEFADHRNYVHGDDFRYLDWNLYGRLDRLFLKLYEEERELPVTVFLDASESMTFGTPAKFDFARQLAAAVGYVALCGFDRVSVRPFPEHSEDAAARGALRLVRGRKSAIRYFQHLHALRAGGRTKLNAALREQALQSRTTGMAVVISDFMDPEGYEEGLKTLVARGFQVTAVQVLAPEEWDPGAYGELCLVDSETGERTEVTFGRHRLDRYQQAVIAFQEEFETWCRGRGIRFFASLSSTSLEDLLLKQLRAAEVWA